MNFETYIQIIKERLSRYFNVKEKYTFNDEVFDIFAVSNIRNEKYMATKKLTIYAFENDEYCFIKYYKELDHKKLYDIIETLKSSIKKYVKPHSEHMSSNITGVLVLDDINDDELIKLIKKFHYQKSFALGFKGWVDVRLLVVNLKNGEVFTSKKARKASKFYQP